MAQKAAPTAGRAGMTQVEVSFISKQVWVCDFWQAVLFEL